MAGVVVAVVDPGERTLRTGVRLDRRELPVGVPRARRAVEREKRQLTGLGEGVGEMLVGFVFPSARPDEVEALRQGEQVVARVGRKEMQDPVHVLKDAFWTGVCVKTPEGDDAVDVNEEHRVCLHLCQFSREPAVSEQAGGDLASLRPAQDAPQGCLPTGR